MELEQNAQGVSEDPWFGGAVEDAQVHATVGREGTGEHPKTDGVVWDIAYKGESWALEDQLGISDNPQVWMLKTPKGPPNRKHVIDVGDMSAPAGS